MRKIISFILLATIVFYACEKDDFCIQNPVTPQLILRFYDTNSRETIKRVEELYVWAEGKDSIFKNIATDSLLIPLDRNSGTTIYNFSKGNVVNQFTIEYETEDEYVSRSCGFRVIYNNVSYSSNNTWIQDFTPTTLLTIDNQDEAHVQIFH